MGSMVDILTPRQRSERMALIRSKNTKPEQLVRSLVKRVGYKYKSHDPNLPGTPDFVFARKKRVIFVNGCFWHGHANCRLARLPKSNLVYWKRKLHANKKRDSRVRALLRAQKWKYMVIWECQIRNQDKLYKKLSQFLRA